MAGAQRGVFSSQLVMSKCLSVRVAVRSLVPAFVYSFLRLSDVFSHVLVVMGSIPWRFESTLGKFLGGSRNTR